ncbi:MAG: hypothetical protein FWF76_00635 [Oscillospiraceae bacterium]|nr:hypothetical protein [Oscillospiraceae bacterium]
MVNKATQQTYHEVKHGRTVYRVTSEFVGKVELAKVLEDLTVRKAVQEATSLLTA